MAIRIVQSLYYRRMIKLYFCSFFALIESKLIRNKANDPNQLVNPNRWIQNDFSFQKINTSKSFRQVVIVIGVELREFSLKPNLF